MFFTFKSINLTAMVNLFRQRHFCRIVLRYYSNNVKKVDHVKFPRQIFSAIQPTGEVHLGNYIGAVKKWTELQSTEENVIFCIADLHSLTIPQDPNILQTNIFLMAATVLASGINPDKSILFQQSNVHQHSELCWIFGTLSTMARLSHLPQFKEKTSTVKEVPVGLFMYPILQAADIALYKATHVPVGVDQIQHIELTNDLIRVFNRKFGITFPKTEAVIDEFAGSIKSLTDPEKKMSKSGLPKSRISLTDSEDEILAKCKKAITDFESKVTFDLENRPGVSNLILIHSYLTNKSTKMICEESQNLNTGQYKLLVADIIIESLRPIREEIERYMSSPDYIEDVLRSGAERAMERAEATMKEVKNKLGVKIRRDSLMKAKNKA